MHAGNASGEAMPASDGRNPSVRRIVAMAVLGTSVLSPAVARAGDADPWFGADKVLHFGASTTIAIGGYAAGAAIFEGRAHALLCGGALAAAAGIGKETLDLAGLGDPSWRDLAWDGIGVVAGLGVAWSADLLLRGVGEKHPLLFAPSVDSRSAGLLLRVHF